MNQLSLEPTASAPVTTASPELRQQVLDTVYEASGIQTLSGYQILCARHRTTNAGIYVVDGDFNRAQFKLAIQEARAAGIKEHRLYVYGRTGSYSGSGICFVKLYDIGITA